MKFNVLVVNMKKKEALVVTTLNCKSEKEARINSVEYMQYANIVAGEQLVVASENRYNKFYKEMVDKTNNMQD